MKAKVLATDEIIDVEKRKERVGRIIYVYYYAQSGESFQDYELEFLPDTPEVVTIEGWVCRDGCENIKDSILRLFLKGEPFPDYRPERVGMNSIQMWKGANGIHLPSEMFSSVTWDSEPLRVKLTLTPMG